MSRPVTVEIIDNRIMRLTAARTDYGTVRIIQSWAGSASPAGSDRAEAHADLEQHVEILTDDLDGLIAALHQIKAAAK